MVPVALATADEYTQCSYNSTEADGKFDKLFKREIDSAWSFRIKESSTALLITDEQQNLVSKNKADNLKKSLRHNIITS